MSDIVEQLVSLTGIDEDQATALLEATNYNLEDAVELFFSNNNGNDSAGKAARTGGRSGGKGAAASPEVRAPDSIRTQQLIPSSFGGVDPLSRGLLLPPGLGPHGLLGGNIASAPSSSSSTNPFTQGVSKNSTSKANRLCYNFTDDCSVHQLLLPEHQKKLAELYRPPDDITFKGTLSQVPQISILTGSIRI